MENLQLLHAAACTENLRFWALFFSMVLKAIVLHYTVFTLLACILPTTAGSRSEVLQCYCNTNNSWRDTLGLLSLSRITLLATAAAMPLRIGTLVTLKSIGVFHKHGLQGLTVSNFKEM